MYGLSNEPVETGRISTVKCFTSPPGPGTTVYVVQIVPPVPGEGGL